MKRYILVLVSLLSILNLRCLNSKQELCTHSIYYYRGAQIAFIGYQPDELDTLYFEQYQKDDQFRHLIKIDTVQSLNTFSIGDTVIKTDSPDYYGFYNPKDGFDYKITSTGFTTPHLITNIETGPISDSFYMDQCSPGAGQAEIRAYSSVTVDGTRQHPVNLAPVQYFVFIKK